ncbi:MAG: hypothetical protein HQM03_11725 [Magnetococcales bacterium]|nr:hypothetical protein [Magnetococcales bacterium]
MPHSPSVTQHRVIIGIAVAGILISLFVFHVMRSQLEHHAQLEFHWLAKDRIGTLRQAIGRAIHVADLFGKLWRDRSPANQELETLARAFFSQVGDLQDVLWIPKPDDPVCRPMQVSRIPGRFPTEEEFRSDPILRTMLQHASSQDRAVVSMSTSPMHAFLIAIPLRQPEGILVIGFDLGVMLRKAMRILEPRGVDILILERDADGRERFIDYYSSRLKPQPDDSEHAVNWREWLARTPHREQEDMPVADKEWTFIAFPVEQLRSGEQFPNVPWLILFGGILTTGMLVLFLLHMESSLREKQRLYAELKQSEIRLRILFNQYPDTIMTVDENGTVLLSNRPDLQRMEEMFGDNSELRDWHARALRKVQATGEMDHFHFPFSESQWCEVRFVPIRSETGISEVLILSTDITERHLQQEQAMRHARLATLGILAAGMAHEINNPNNTIQFNIDSLLRAWPDMAAVLRYHGREHGEYAIGGMPADRALEMLPGLLESIRDNSRRITGIVNNLKHMARPDTGEQRYRIELHKVLRNVVSLVQHQIKRHTDHFTVNLPDDLPELKGNPLQLEQLFLNLLLNAMESLRDRHGRVALDGLASEDGKWVIVQVMDEGVGMTRQEIADMFTPFFTTKAAQGGIGMGLSIVWDIVQRHGGAIQADSQPGAGTTITVRLPTAPQKEHA